jgi:hypothetical protein
MFSIRGYACPFNSVAVRPDDGVHQEIAPNALTLRRNVEFLFGSHDQNALRFASTTNDTARFFNDAYGLGFEAEFALTRKTIAIMRAAKRLELRASVNLLCIKLKIGRTKACDIVASRKPKSIMWR